MTPSIVILSEKGLEWSISPSGRSRKKKKRGERHKNRDEDGEREREREQRSEGAKRGNKRKYWVSASDICSRGHNNKTPSRSASHHICSHNASASKAQIKYVCVNGECSYVDESAHGSHIYLHAILLSSRHRNSSHLKPGLKRTLSLWAELTSGRGFSHFSELSVCSWSQDASRSLHMLIYYRQ